MHFSKFVLSLCMLCLAGWPAAPEATAQTGPSLGLDYAAGVATLSITGTVGSAYAVQNAADLSRANAWITLTNITLQSTPDLFVDTTAPAATQRFYRIVPSAPSPTCLNQSLIDFEGGADGAQVSVDALNASLHGYGGVFTIAEAQYLAFSALGQKSLLGPVTLCAGGLQPGGGSLGLQCITPGLTGQYIDFWWTNAVSSSASFGLWFMTDVPETEVSWYDFATIIDTNFNAYFNPCIDANGKYLRMRPEIKPTPVTTNTIGSCVFSSGQWYWLTAVYSKSPETNEFSMYDAGGNLMGSVYAQSLATTLPSRLRIGVPYCGDTNTHHFWYDNIKIDPSGSFPLLPTAPPP